MSLLISVLTLTRQGCFSSSVAGEVREGNSSLHNSDAIKVMIMTLGG